MSIFPAAICLMALGAFMVSSLPMNDYSTELTSIATKIYESERASADDRSAAFTNVSPPDSSRPTSTARPGTDDTNESSATTMNDLKSEFSEDSVSYVNVGLVFDMYLDIKNISEFISESHMSIAQTELFSELQKVYNSCIEKFVYFQELGCYDLHIELKDKCLKDDLKKYDSAEIQGILDLANAYVGNEHKSVLKLSDAALYVIACHVLYDEVKNYKLQVDYKKLFDQLEEIYQKCVSEKAEGLYLSSLLPAEIECLNVYGENHNIKKIQSLVQKLISKVN